MAHEEPDDVVSDGLRTIEEARQFTRLSRSALYGLMERRELAYTKIGGRRLIPVRALLALAQKNLVAQQDA